MSDKDEMENDNGDIYGDEESLAEDVDIFEEDEEEQLPEDKDVVVGSNFKKRGPKVPDNERITTPFMTKYERARIIGTRAL